MSEFSHLNAAGEAHMVDISAKPESARLAVAEAWVQMAPATLAAIYAQELPKGDVLAVARVAGIQGAKRCADLIPLCHPLPLQQVVLSFEPQPPDRLRIEVTCKVSGKTGVEMEALTAATVAALTIYDMCKALDKGMQISQVRLLEKQGGRSGHWQAST